MCSSSVRQYWYHFLLLIFIGEFLFSLYIIQQERDDMIQRCKDYDGINQFYRQSCDAYNHNSLSILSILKSSIYRFLTSIPIQIYFLYETFNILFYLIDKSRRLLQYYYDYYYRLHD